jgi:CxxC-x17-CxxC domain-containing protein
MEKADFIKEKGYPKDMAYFKREKFERRDSGKGRRFRETENSERRFGRKRSFDPEEKPFGRRNNERPNRAEEHEAICDKCGQQCVVPFRPTGNKPIYCSNCFRKKDNFEQTSGRSSGDLAEINRKLDMIMKKLGI